MRKKQRGRGFEQPVTSELTSAQCPLASPSSQREHSPVLYTQHDQRPSAAASNMISFRVSDNELDDSFSLAASDARPSSSPKYTTSSRNRGTPPTHLASVLLLQLLSHPLMALKKGIRAPASSESVHLN